MWSVHQFDHFLVFCSSYSQCPRALDGVSVTFVLQFHTRKHYKTAIQSECIVSQGVKDYFLSVCVQSYAQSDNSVL